MKHLHKQLLLGLLFFSLLGCKVVTAQTRLLPIMSLPESSLSHSMGDAQGAPGVLLQHTLQNRVNRSRYFFEYDHHMLPKVKESRDAFDRISAGMTWGVHTLMVQYGRMKLIGLDELIDENMKPKPLDEENFKSHLWAVKYGYLLSDSWLIYLNGNYAEERTFTNLSAATMGIGAIFQNCFSLKNSEIPYSVVLGIDHLGKIWGETFNEVSSGTISLAGELTTFFGKTLSLSPLFYASYVLHESPMVSPVLFGGGLCFRALNLFSARIGGQFFSGGSSKITMGLGLKYRPVLIDFSAQLTPYEYRQKGYILSFGVFF